MGDAFKIVESKEKGRGLQSIKKIPLGQVVLMENPYASVVSDQLLQIHCQSCLQRMQKKFRCNGCKFIHYCSVNCQKNDWNEHKEECKMIQKISPNKPTETVRMLARILQKKDSKDDKYKQFCQLVSRK